MTLPGNLGTLDWDDWFLGLWSAIITGGSSAVISASGLTLMDPKDFSLQEGKLWALAGGMFLWNGFLGMMMFLRTKPAPVLKTTVMTVKTTEQVQAEPSIKVETIKTETTVAPVKPADKP